MISRHEGRAAIEARIIQASTADEPIVHHSFCSFIDLHRIVFTRASEESFRTGLFDAMEALEGRSVGCLLGEPRRSGARQVGGAVDLRSRPENRRTPSSSIFGGGRSQNPPHLQPSIFGAEDRRTPPSLFFDPEYRRTPPILLLRPSEPKIGSKIAIGPVVRKRRRQHLLVPAVNPASSS